MTTYFVSNSILYAIRKVTEIPGPGMFVFCLQINRIAVKAPDSLQWAPVREVSNNTAVSTINHHGNFSSVPTEFYVVLTLIRYASHILPISKLVLNKY